MSGTLTYDERYNDWFNKVMPEMQENIEGEILTRLIGGSTQYQRLILNHTCSDMFNNKDYKSIYNIIIKYLQTRQLEELNTNNLIISLDDKDVKYAEYILHLGTWCMCSADASNWIMQLQALYEKKLYKNCNSRSDFIGIEKEIAKYKFQNTEQKLTDVAMNYLYEYDTMASSIIKTYYQSIDNLIGGLQGGNYMILAGSTGMGKTVMALNLMLSMAKHNKNVLLFSLEMTADELLSRIIAEEISISSEELRNRSLEQDDLDKYAKYITSEAFDRLQKLITIPSITNLDIGKIEEIVRKSKADVIFIDYLGLIKSDNVKANTYEQISDISRRLKLLAIETKKPLIVLHQLNRDMKSRKDKHPTLSDIRDSGKIEQDADFITFVYRPAYYDSTANKTTLEFMVAKARHTSGAGKIATLMFQGQYQKIVDPLGETRDVYSQRTLRF